MKNFILTLSLLVFATNVNSQTDNHTIVAESENTNSECNSVANYYYFPNMQVYFDLDKKIYHYQVNNTWVTSEELPQYYGGYSLFKNERVMVTIANGEEPEKYIKEHRKAFPYNPKGRIKRPVKTTITESALATLQ